MGNGVSNPFSSGGDKKGSKRSKKLSKKRRLSDIIETSNPSLTEQAANELLDKLKETVLQLSLTKPLEEPVSEHLAVIYKIYYEIKNLKNDIYFIKAGNILTINDHFLHFSTKVWDVCHQKKSNDENHFISSPKYQMMKTILWNYSNNCGNLCERLYHQRELMMRMMKEFTSDELSVEKLKINKRRFLIKATLGILHNSVRWFDTNKRLIRLNDGINNLHKYYSSTFLIVKAKIMILLAYCVNDKENETLTTGSGVIAFILKLLTNALSSESHTAKTYAFSATETVAGLDRLCINDKNKVLLVEQGILKLLMKMIKENVDEEELFVATHCLWTLSFHEENKEKFKQEDGLMDFVTNILKNSDKSAKKLSRSCNGIYFNVQGYSFERAEPDKSREIGESAQIMISYQWNVQPAMKRISSLLKSAGFRVWIDIESMEGSILTAMASAVEGAQVVIIAMSEKYKNSNPCRTEAEYAYKLHKPIVPLLVEKNYQPDGWLGALLGLQLYIDVTSAIDDKFPEILKQITSHTNEIQRGITNGGVDSIPHKLLASKGPHYSTWSQQEVREWAEKTTIDGLPKALYDFDGSSLEVLFDSYERSPDFFYKSIKEDFQLSLINCLKFIKALKQL